jgi:small subunit ribosomal protein S16
MVKIRLQRFGSKKAPFYRIVASESKKPRDGKFLEKLGEYNPQKSYWSLDASLVQAWIDKGAVPTVTVRNIIKKNKEIKL